MTPRHYQLLARVDACCRENGYSPSYEELSRDLGLATKSGIKRLADALIDSGYLRSEPGGSRTLRVTALGAVALAPPGVPTQPPLALASSRDLAAELRRRGYAVTAPVRPGVMT